MILMRLSPLLERVANVGVDEDSDDEVTVQPSNSAATRGALAVGQLITPTAYKGERSSAA